MYIPCNKVFTIMSSVTRVRIKGGKVVQWCDVYVGRRATQGGWNLKNSKWGNENSAKKFGRHESIMMYLKDIYDNNLVYDVMELKGQILGCWCKPEECHADVLVTIINMVETIQYMDASDGSNKEMFIFPSYIEAQDGYLKTLKTLQPQAK